MTTLNPVYNFVEKNMVLSRIEKVNLSKSKNLSLEGNNLTTIPETLFSCKTLEVLNLAHNCLPQLHQNLVTLVNLQHLSIPYNNIDKFPEILSEVPLLKTLNLSNNPVRDLTGVEKLVTLEVLWVNNCCLSSLPQNIGNLRKLDTFGARHNKIEALPETIGELQQLRWLTLENNQLRSLPHSIGELKELVHLNLNKNNFNTIPIQLSSIKTLKFLHLQSNEFFDFEESILKDMTGVKINLLHNPISNLKKLEELPNVVVVEREEIEHNMEDSNGSESSSSDDWENSLESSDLNFSPTNSESEEEFFVEVEIPKLSKYLLNF